jgi:hypothetical protein
MAAAKAYLIESEDKAKVVMMEAHKSKGVGNEH